MREIHKKFALKLVAKQMMAAIIFSMGIAWIGYFLQG
jgi:uncharacterized protein (DUF486 family)